MYSPGFLKKLRNNIQIEYLITNELKIPNKYSEGYFRFLCPLCFEFNKAIKKLILYVVLDVNETSIPLTLLWFFVVCHF